MEEIWDTLYINCFQYLGFKSVKEILESEFKDYLMRMESVRRNKLESERDLHYSAYLNMVVESTEEKQKGKREPVFKTFNDFFNYKEAKEDIVGITRDNKIMEIDEEKELEISRENRLKELVLEANKGGED